MNGNRYSVTAILLHWVMAVLVLAQFALGWWMLGIPKDPPGPRARTNHALLYACMLVMPVSGYLGSSFTKYPVKYFGLTLPSWGWDAPALKDLFSAIHYATVWLFMALVALHVAAALKHLLADRDEIFARMWPRRQRDSLHSVE